MQNQSASPIKNLTPSNPPPYFKGGLGGVTSRLGSLFVICLIASVIALFFSFVGFLLPIFREAAFFIILAAVLVLSFYRLQYGLYAALVELILGSKGYLFYFDFGNFNVSLRIGIFLVVFGVFLAKLILKKIEFVWDKRLAWLVPFFVAIVVGFGQGLLRDFGFQNVFLDANGYFYLLYLFPFLSAFAPSEIRRNEPVFQDKEKFKKIKGILLSSGLVLAIFSLFLFYIFSHDWLNSDLVYRWLRNNLLFEITYTGSVFRIFAQSQIFLLAVFFLALKYLIQRENLYLAVVSVFLSLTAILVSLSRSFFVGLLAGLFVFFIIFCVKQKEVEPPLEVRPRSIKKEFLKMALVVILVFIASVAFLWTIEPQEPYALIGRAASIKPSAIKIEPASFTRQEELKPLFLEIIKKPFLGWGFGKTVIFETRDPRALTTLSQCVGKESCLYKTYAFEWGYLDLWLKLGLFGLVSLGGILYALFKRGMEEFKKGNWNSLWVVSSLAAVAVTNIFSPYLNHPLGIGILIILTIEILYFKR